VQLVVKLRRSGMASDLDAQVRELRQQVEMMRVTVKLDLKDLGQQMESARDATRNKVAELGQRLEHQLPGIVREVVRQEISCSSQKLKRDVVELSQRTEKRADATNKGVTSLTQEVNRVKDKFARDVFRVEQQLHHLNQVVRQDVVLLAMRTSTSSSDTNVLGTMGEPGLCSLPSLPKESVCTTAPQGCSRSSSWSTSVVSCSDQKGDSTPDAGRHSEGNSVGSGLHSLFRLFNQSAGLPTPGGLPNPSCEDVSSSPQPSTTLLLGSSLQPSEKNRRAQLLRVVDCDSDV